MIYLLNRKEAVQGILSNNMPKACPYYDDNMIEDLDTYRLTFEFKVPANHSTAALVKEGLYFVTRGLDEEFLMFKIIICKNGFDSAGPYIYAYGESAGLELLKAPCRPIYLTSQSPEDAMTYMLNGTRWSVGQIGVGGTANILFTNYTTILAELPNVAKLYEGELKYRVAFSGGRVIGRYVDLLDRRGSITGKRFTYKKDLVGLTKTVDTSNLFTGLIGVGPADENGNYMTFKDLNSVLYNKPAGQDFIADEEALEKWGDGDKHLIGIFEVQDAENKEALMDLTYEELQKVKEPVFTYDVQLILLGELLGRSWEDIRLGDTVGIYDTQFPEPIMLTARVQSLSISKTNPEASSATLSDFIPAKTNINKTLQDLQAKLSKGGGVWDNAAEIAADAVTKTEAKTAGAVEIAGGNLQGSIPLGGTSNPTGQVIVQDANDEIIGNLNEEVTDEETGETNLVTGFQRLNVQTLYASESISAPNLVTMTTDPINYYVDPINGNDDNAGISWADGGLQSIQEAIDRLPKILVHDVKIQVHYNNGKEINENVMIQGFSGNGVLTIDFQNTSNVVYGGFKYMYNTIKCVVNKGKIISTSTDNPIYSEGTANIRLDGTICDAKGLSSYAIMVSNGYADLRGAEFYNGVSACVLVGYGGRGDVVNCKGSGSPYGLRTYRSGFIAGSGTAPTGSISNQYEDEGGLIQGEWTYPVVSAPVTPAPATYKTVTVTSTGGNSWRSASGGQWYGGNVRQALYSTQYGRYQGYWFFGNALDQFNGKQITSVRIWCRRYKGGGASAAQKARFVLHGYGSQPSGSTQPTFYNGGINTTTAYTSYFKWGEGKTIDATAAFKSHINQAGVKGIGLWVYANSPYMIFENHMTITVTYKE
jgi:phage minor structural protein